MGGGAGFRGSPPASRETFRCACLQLRAREGGGVAAASKCCDRRQSTSTIWIIIVGSLGLELTRIEVVSEQTLALIRARNRAFRWPKGTSGNPTGQSRFYHECRRLAREAGPEMMKVLIDLASDPAADERVRSVCAVAVLDRGGVKPIDKPEAEPELRQKFNPRAYTPADLAVIEAALKLMAQGGSAPAEPEVIPPGVR